MKRSHIEIHESDIEEMFKDYVQLNPADGVYTNRDLNLEEIKMVGFDMDYTLAMYRKETMEELQFRMTLQSLVAKLNYPHEITAIKYHQNLTIRGLMLDKERGDLLKTDIHGRVWRAMHGHKQLRYNDIESIYSNTKIHVGDSRFGTLDSLFAIPEAALYISLLDFFEGRVSRGEDITPLQKKGSISAEQHIDHWKLYDDIRQCMDGIHADGSLKGIITKNLAHYINNDSDISLTLHKLRSAGKKIFLLTNSEWFYTDAVMTYLLEGHIAEYTHWQSYFDIIIVEARKPKFFTLENLFHTFDPNTKTTHEISERHLNLGFEKNTIYQHGNIRDFERLCRVNGDEILYIGDHIYGDIVRTKKETLWRTCLVVDELSEEIRHTLLWARDLDEISRKNAQRHALDGMIRNQRALLAHIEGRILEQGKKNRDQLEKYNAAHKLLKQAIEKNKRDLTEMDREYLVDFDELERRFHPCWGRVFGEHGELSSFGGQVRTYACIYTAKVTNLLRYSTTHLFRATGQMMSHERILIDSMPMRKARLNDPL